MARTSISRRRFVSATAAASATAISAPFVRTAHAAGKLSIGFWDHWVPSANAASRALIEEWAAKEKVDVQIDYITSQGEKLLLTTPPRSQARSGHDIMTMRELVAARLRQEPRAGRRHHGRADQAERRRERHGRLSRPGGRTDWLAVPATTGSQIKGPCSRIDLMKQHAGIDVQAHVSGRRPPKADDWTLDTFLKAAEACHKAGLPVRHRARHDRGLGRHRRRHLPVASARRSSTPTRRSRSRPTPCARRSTTTRGLPRFFPPDAPAWDDASNNKWLVSGKGALIMNPPSAWAVAKRDAPQGRRAAVDARHAVGPEGPLRAVHPVLLGRSGTSARTSRRPRACWCTCRSRRRSRRWWRRSDGFDLPSFANLTTLKTWAEEGPPKGTLYHYPNPLQPPDPVDRRRRPSPPKIAQQIYAQGIMTKMTVRHLQGEPMEKTLAWAETRGRRLHAQLTLDASTSTEARRPHQARIHPSARSAFAVGRIPASRDCGEMG